MKFTNSKRRNFLVTSTIALGLMGAAATAGAADYSGTAYVAGMGGHFAKAGFTIDPTAETPITITSLDKIDIGTAKSHPTHDARIDATDRNIMYWSTYKLDAEADNSYHYGTIDLSTDKVTNDVTTKIPEGNLNSAAGYCASAQTKDYFMPITMLKPGYISVIRKSDMKLMRNVYLEGTDADIKKGYKYLHGTNSPDMKEILITINESDTAPDDKELGNVVGKLHLFALDAAALENGKVKVLRKGVVDGNAKKSTSFRQYYSPDGKYIANATGDTLFLIDAKTLTAVDAEPMPNLEETHDAIFTADSKYVIATSRTKALSPECKDPEKPADGEWTMDGQLKLYDVEAKKFIGKPSSVCLSCHDQQLGAGYTHAVLCGLDVNFAKK
ncbi:MAG: hypothetical protein K0A99_04205 [Desulfoarculaceae bacterium]|nr:hypothetical protein [Desulfoarculaceae bacterium]